MMAMVILQVMFAYLIWSVVFGRRLAATSMEKLLMIGAVILLFYLQMAAEWLLALATTMALMVPILVMFAYLKLLAEYGPK
jgi:hypothetical protein